MIEDNLERFYFALPAKGRTNTELREKFILSENVVGQGMSSFTNKPSTSSKLSGRTRSGSTTPINHHYHSHYGHSHHLTPPTPVQRGTTPDREVSAIMSYKSRESPSYTHLGGATNSLSSSRASSRCSEVSEDAEPYAVRDTVDNSRTTPSGPNSVGAKSRIPLSRNSSIRKPSYR
ncbi:hypothetical protein EB796_016784 [Bugula neritina]|uniref:Uncharacterized protein n=1 Tax=Bugula neritina TaxID=10212 RepID=A0A7J7JFA0_BUGNE|nr:hypothetical protein EB796_016784 [Bugula neritina]